MSKEAMKLALEALEKLDKVMKRSPDTDKAITAIKQALEQPEPEPDRKAFERYWKKTRGEKKSDRELKRHPLQPQVYIQDSANRHWVTWQAATKKASTPKREQEPVAWAISFDGETPYTLWDGGDCALLDIEVKRHGGKTRKMPLYTSPPKREPPCKTGSQCTTKCMECTEPEPVAWVERDGELVWNNREAAIGRNLYASPPKREPEPVIDKSAAIRIATSLGWTPQRKPLTDEEIYDMYNEPRSDAEMLEFARSIEAAHGIKGEA